MLSLLCSSSTNVVVLSHWVIIGCNSVVTSLSIQLSKPNPLFSLPKLAIVKNESRCCLILQFFCFLKWLPAGFFGGDRIFKLHCFYLVLGLRTVVRMKRKVSFWVGIWPKSFLLWPQRCCNLDEETTEGSSSNFRLQIRPVLFRFSASQLSS